MAFPNISDILATTIESRTKTIADNVTDNNAVLKQLSLKGKIKPFSGGHKIYQEMSFAENSNASWYSGYDILPTGASDVISAAEFEIKQAAVPVTISGLEMLQNSGKERMIDLMESRMSVAESTLANIIAAGLYSDGTGFGAKEIDGLDAALSSAPTSGTYGGINRANYAFWRNQLKDVLAADLTSANIGGHWNELWADCQRGNDRIDMILCDSTVWQVYVASLQAQQRFTSPETGNLGFPTLKFMDADVVLDGGIGGNCPAGQAFFLNTKYLHYRPHSNRNMVPLAPDKRFSTDQDAEVQIIGWAGNLTCSGAQFQGRYEATGT